MSPIAVDVASTSTGPSTVPDVIPYSASRERWIWLSPNGSQRELTAFVDSVEVEKGMNGRYSPPLVTQAFVVPGISGQYVNDVRHDVREIDVPLVATAATASALRSLMRDMSSEFNSISGPGILRHIDIDGSQADLYCYCTTGLAGASEGANGPILYRETLIFQAFDPYWYQTPYSVRYQNAGSGSFFPILPLRLSQSTVLGDVLFDNTGDVVAYPVWTIAGPGTSATLTNNTTGQTLSITQPLSTGDIVTINTQPGNTSVIGPNGSNWRRYLTSRYLWNLQPGINDITLSMAGGTTASYIQLTYTPRTLAP